ncbi:hypothetical protein Bhyg_06512 [Pseudolycoriella hygida]|uniref:Uncharacterized protein n=1 Tax=Pseudolycoriella hygida TaxID=35572 RepID=A0A9Q0N0T5_9DIPT|nr:hypothetical protein Bhyg_06512 [Pseudolycoriella hygida]
MKSFILFVTLCVGYINSTPVPNGLRYYRTPFSGQYRPYPMHHTMLLHYNNPYAARSTHASEITAFASGDRIGTGTYYENQEPAQEFQPPPPPPPQPINDFNEPSPDESTGGNALSVAESFPEEDEPNDPDLQQENDVLFEPNPPISYEPLPQKESISPVAPTVTPAKPIVAQPPKINVDIENVEDDEEIIPVNTKKQPPSQGSWPLHNFFPITFGSSSGGAIAIANSFSTGKGGTAASRATAYGSSSKQKLKKQVQQ